jgi:predicted dehydrogenase
MKKLRVGVVGVGHIGSNHARLYAEIPSAEFTAVYDVEPFRSSTIATKSGAASAKSLDDFIAMVDAASVATPTNTRLPELSSPRANMCSSRNRLPTTPHMLPSLRN